MLGNIKDKNGRIIGYIEWNILDKKGQFKKNGEYVYIADMWIHERFKETGLFSQLVKIIDNHPYARNAEYVYWEFKRDKEGKKITDNEIRVLKNLKQSKIYKREYIANKILKRGTYV